MAHGRPVWYDLMTDDSAGAIAFYREVVGWETRDWDGERPYTMWSIGPDQPIGGLMAPGDAVKAAGAPAHWIAYVGVADVEATGARAVALGGQVLVPPTAIAGTSRFTILRDPQGAVFACYSSEDAEAADWSPPTGVGAFVWSELNTTDWIAARAFYQALFDWQEVSSLSMFPGDDGVFWIFGVDGERAGGMSNIAKVYKAPPHWLHYVQVADIDAALTRIKALGGGVNNGPMTVAGGDRVAQCRDPQGAVFGVSQRNPARG